MAKHAEPAAEEVSQNIEEGAHRFAHNAGPATKELTDRAIEGAHNVAKNAKPTADQVLSFACVRCSFYSLAFALISAAVSLEAAFPLRSRAYYFLFAPSEIVQTDE